MSGRHNVDGRVSVVVVTYNSEHRYIEQCLHSLINQTYDNLEIVLVDGGSTDSTMDIVNGILGPSGRKYLIYHTNGPEAQSSIGLSWPFLVGAGNSTGEYLILHADDDYDHPDRIRLLVKAIGDAPMAHSTFIMVNRDGRQIGRHGADMNEGLYDAVVNHTEDAFIPHIMLYAGMCQKHLYFSERCYILGKNFWEAIHTVKLYGIGDLVYVPESIMYMREWSGQTSRMGSATDLLVTESGYDKNELHMGKYNYALDSVLRDEQTTHDWDEVIRITNVEAKRIARGRFE